MVENLGLGHFFFHKYVLVSLHEWSMVFMFVLIFLWSGKKEVKSGNLKITALSEYGDD